MSQMKQVRFGIVAAAVFLGTSVFAEQAEQTSPSLPPIVAKVNGVDIPLSRFWSGLLTSAGDTVLTALVDEILIEQEMDKKFGVEPAASGRKNKALEKLDQEVAKRYGEFKKQFKDEETFLAQIRNAGATVERIQQQIRLDLYKEELLADRLKVTKEEAKKFFDENREKLAAPERVHLKHILVGSEREAADALLALKVGANFELLAQEKSMDEATRSRGGDLGVFAAGMLSPEIEKKAFSMQAGAMDVIKTDQGYHVIKVAEKMPAQPAEWNPAMQDTVEKMLKQQKFNTEYPPYIQSLRKKADIKIFLKS